MPIYWAIFIPEGIETPSLAISLYKEYRGFGIGTALMEEILARLNEYGYKRVFLSVQKANYAVKLYQKVGFVERTVEKSIFAYKDELWSRSNMIISR